MSLTIKENVCQILSGLPEGVGLVAAAKAQTAEEVLQAVSAGVQIIGHNYVQEAEKHHLILGNQVQWHFIGHLQKNKVKKAIQIFDMIETVDSLELAEEIDKRCWQAGKVMPVLIEINSGHEIQKSGVPPEKAARLAKDISALGNVKLMGLMTIGPYPGLPDESRPYFTATRQVFEHIGGLNLPNVTMKYLSMGMTSNYNVAIEEGANLVRIGTKIFGERKQ